MPRDSPEKNTPRRLFGNSAGYSADSVVACGLPKKIQEVNEMANVKMIAPQTFQPEHMRVAAYCRVSSDSKDQLHSYAAQIRSYTEEIAQHDSWELVDVYADEGLTGTRMDKREDFNRMMRDCRKGKIDRILVKSVSRFARNTKDCLSALRELSALGISVQFEKENIDTGTLTSELMVSVSGALAQQESISISQNLKIAWRRMMAAGDFVTTNPPFGYELVDGCGLRIKESEADIVRWIFASYLDGISTREIAKSLTERGILTTEGNAVWNPRSVQLILDNEKHKGDTFTLKRYTTNQFPFAVKRNHGEVDQYYIENSHPAIINTDTFERVQKLKERRTRKRQLDKQDSPLRGKMACGVCGTALMRRTTGKGLISWVCRKHDENAADCPVGRIPETEIYAAFVRMYNKIRANADIVLKPALTQLDDLERALQRENPAMLEINRAIAQVAEQSHNISKLQTAGLLDADACAAKLSSIQIKLTQLRRERRRLLEHDDIEDAISRLHQTADTIKSGPEQLDTFDESLFEELVERIIAESQTCIRFRLWGGVELTEEVRRAKR